MEDRPQVNEKTLFQIVIRVTLVWMYFSFMIALLFNLHSDPTPIRSALITAVFIGAFEIPFGIMGGYIGKVWRKTPRATRNGVSTRNLACVIINRVSLFVDAWGIISPFT